MIKTKKYLIVYHNKESMEMFKDSITKTCHSWSFEFKSQKLLTISNDQHESRHYIFRRVVPGLENILAGILVDGVIFLEGEYSNGLINYILTRVRHYD